MAKWWVVILPIGVVIFLTCGIFTGLLLASNYRAEQHAVQILDRRFTDIQIAQGKRLYLQNCAQCHGVMGAGQFPLAPLEPDATGRIGAPPHNETGHTWHHSDVLLIRYVTDGGFADLTRFYEMPAFKNKLTDEQVLLILAYIKTMWTDEQRMMQRQLTQEEQRLFAEVSTPTP
jgi:mono/diheme cytochrome c family protein